MRSPSPKAPSLRRRRAVMRVSGFVGLMALVLVRSSTASAHLRLMNPPSWIEEDSLGNPQKTAPCGGEMEGERTGIISTYRAGSTIEVQWHEGVAHPGHFRIAVARERSELQDPAVQTTNGDGVTGVSLTADIMSPVSYPVLLDGLFPRTVVFEPQEEPFTVQVQLPPFTCEKCTLQVVQFMANHVPGYFYHHCADIRLVAANADVPDAALGAGMPMPVTGGSNLGAGAASSADTDSGGCRFATRPTPSSVPSVGLLLLGIAGALRRRLRS